MIYATIDQQAGIVSFHNNPDRCNTTAVLNKIHNEVNIYVKQNRGDLHFFTRWTFSSFRKSSL